MRNNRRKPPKSLFLLLAFSALLLVVMGCTGAVPIGWSGPLIDEQTLYIGDPKGELLALNVQNGNQLWAKKLVGPSRGGFACIGTQQSSAIYGTPAVSDGIVYSASYNGKAYAFDAATGQQKWVYPGDRALRPIVSGPVVENGIVVFGDTDGNIYGLDAVEGSEEWVFATEGKAWATPVAEDGIFYIPSLDGHIYALTTGGSQKWKTGEVGGIVASPALSATTIYVGSLDNNLYAFDKANGTKKWQFSGGNFFWAGPVLTDSLVVAANTEGKVYGIEADTGRQSWVWNAPGQASISSTPTIIGETVVVGTADGKINVIDAATGRPARDPISTGTTGTTSIKGPLTSRDNVVYARVESDKRSFVIGYDITNGTQVMSKELVATIAPSDETPQGGSSLFSWQTILLIGAGMIILYLLMGRRQARP